jgi:methionyl-tRNA formyltransferase
MVATRGSGPQRAESRGSLRVVFLGTPQFAVPTLERLLASSHTVVGVVTQPDRPRGRGHKTSDAPVKARAIDAGIPVLQPATLKGPDAVSAIAALHADIGVVAAYGKILTEAILHTPAMGMVNVHASLLPRYRGAAPVHRAVIAGESQTGVTIMRVVRALDAGAMLDVVHRSIDPDETSEDVERDLAQLGAQLLVSTLDRLARGPIEEIAQDEARSTYAPRLTKEDGLVDWARPAVDVHNLIRGLHPWPHAYTFWNGRRLILLRSSPSSGTTHAQGGVVIAAHSEELRIAAGEGHLQILELQAEGKRPMTAREFLAGTHIEPGDIFGPPS